jgi:hypothetical protein
LHKVSRVKIRDNSPCSSYLLQIDMAVQGVRAVGRILSKNDWLKPSSLKQSGKEI